MNDAAMIKTLCDLLHHRAQTQPEDRAYVFLSERGYETGSLTFSSLHERALAIATNLAARFRPGNRALLVFPQGLDFLIGFFGCVLAGLIPVPLMPPRRNSSRDATAKIIADCDPAIVLTNGEFASSPRGNALQNFTGAGIKCLLLSELSRISPFDTSNLPTPAASDIAFLQYTSGSTSAPKGVMVSHGNLIANLEMINIAFGNTRRSTYVSWLPLYHDMGLILSALGALYAGSLCVLLAPTTFMHRPLTWLRAIDFYRAEVAGNPNFAFDHCVDRITAEQAADLDLSCWSVAPIGAEPVSHDTILRFADAFRPSGFSLRAVYPGYGLAEATVMVSGRRRGNGPVVCTVSRDGLQRNDVRAPTASGDAQVLVGCGGSIGNEQIAVVEPSSLKRLETNCVGEVWVGGPNVAAGYWKNPEATAATFGAAIYGEQGNSWLRTGDLGFLNNAGELFITGRIKDVLIIRGINHYPQDIEATVQAAHPALRRNCGAAFAAQDGHDREKVVVVQEVERTLRESIDPDEIATLIREAVANDHEVTISHVALVKPGVVPKTTSGKIQRSLTRKLWLERKLPLLRDSDQP
jgi:acyl-CoA synthetase (AMP-forming)/AMP-acid ligase II